MKVPEPKKLNSGNWFINLRVGGANTPITRPTYAECKRAAELIKAEYRAGKRATQNTSDATLSEAIDRYISNRSAVLSPSTIRGYRTIQRTRFQSIMNRPVSKIESFQAVCNQEAKLCSPKTLKNAVGFIRSAAQEAGVSLPEVRLPQIVADERPFLEPEQIPTFLDAIKDKQCELAALLALHSLRRSEIMGMTWDKIDLKNNVLKVSGSVVFDENHKPTAKKTNKNIASARVVPIMIPRLRELLCDTQEKSGVLVACNANTIWAQINRACKSNDLPEVGVHGLRHSFASLAYHLGLSERETMELGGWSDTGTMRKIYTHLAQQDRAKAVNKMAEFYSNRK